MASRELGFTLGPVNYAFQTSSLPGLHGEMGGAGGGQAASKPALNMVVAWTYSRVTWSTPGGKAENRGEVMKTGKDQHMLRKSL